MSTDRSTIEGSASEAGGEAAGNGGAPAQATLTVTDNRTGASYELPIEDGTVRGMDLRSTTRRS
jgi:citrate synthase